MYHPLVPCIACARHVRAGEPACPFCGAAPTDALPPPRALAPSPPWKSRSARLIVGASLAMGACSQSVGNTDVLSGNDSAAAMETSSALDAAVDAPGEQVVSPTDAFDAPLRMDVATSDARDVVGDEVSIIAPYGAPPPPPPPPIDPK